MLKANSKKLLLALISLTLFLGACSSPEEKRIEQLSKAENLQQSGDYAEAIDLLETLAETYPNDADILKQIAGIYAEQSDYTMAAFYYENAATHAPKDPSLLFFSYQAHRANNDTVSASKILEKLVLMDSGYMTSDLWLALGDYRAFAENPEAALEAYLQAIDLAKEEPEPATAVTIGDLYLQLDNLNQADYWYRIAAKTDDPNALAALFGILDIQVRKDQWEAAEKTMAELDKAFPGAVDASEWAQSARDQLNNWRKTEETLNAEKEKAKQMAAAEKVRIEELSTEVAQISDEEDTLTISPNSNEPTANEKPSGKAQILEDLELAEAFANKPAVESEADEVTGTVVVVEPKLTNDDLGIETTLPPIRPSTPAPTIDELILDAQIAAGEMDYERSINLYWQALSVSNNRADIWSDLSRTYLINGQSKNAETTALEAIRLAPSNMKYMLDYLRVAQRSKKPDDFLAELETAYDRFPTSPEITLSLARAYERISRNYSSARTLYERFVELGPNHPLRPEAETAIQRLR